MHMPPHTYHDLFRAFHTPPPPSVSFLESFISWSQISSKLPITMERSRLAGHALNRPQSDKISKKKDFRLAARNRLYLSLPLSFFSWPYFLSFSKQKSTPANLGQHGSGLALTKSCCFWHIDNGQTGNIPEPRQSMMLDSSKLKLDKYWAPCATLYRTPFWSKKRKKNTVPTCWALSRVCDHAWTRRVSWCAVPSFLRKPDLMSDRSGLTKWQSFLQTIFFTDFANNWKQRNWSVVVRSSHIVHPFF